MRRVLLFLLLLVAMPAAAEPARLFDGALSFDLPPGFRRMTEAEITAASPFPWLLYGAQHDGFADSDGLTMIAAMRALRPGLSASDLTAIGQMMQHGVALRVGMTVRRHGLVAIGRTRWYAIEFSSQAAGEPVEFLTRVGLQKQYFVVVSAKAVTRVFQQREAALRRALETMKPD
ncbi:MAG: hypothetical protein KF889_21340 [Alphaproteobacteria bacterium]|nr:hypothetical protein [Alphaproteobacteria bacterium]MCW5743184.1 hypothetical protein [Alphaproteobacteria bacterium]